MVERPVQLSKWPGTIAAFVIVAVVLGALAAVLSRAEAGQGFAPSDWAAVRFTVWQAFLSAVLSVFFAIPVARALARRSFKGRSALITLLGAPFILPVVVAVMGLLVVFGRNGFVNDGLAALGLPQIGIYGLQGVLLAHVFFNMPLATRLLLQGWHDIPTERFRLAASLGFSGRDIFRVLERPMLLRVVPGALAIIFAICLTSFAVALTIGGGPKATTVELAIYEAFRFDFDLGRAAMLSIVQILIAGVAATVAFKLVRDTGFAGGLDRPVQRWDDAGSKWFDASVITIAALFLIVPMGAVVLRGLGGLFEMPNSVYFAGFTSIWVALLSTAVLMTVALPIAAMIVQSGKPWSEAIGFIGLTASPLMIGTGLFILINPWANPTSFALIVTAGVNSILALPFALRIIVPSMRETVQTYGRLAASLGIGGWALWRLVLLPRLRPQLGFAAGLAAAFSIGDLGVIALFDDPDRTTLPLQMYRLMGSYQNTAAAGAAVLLLVLAFGVFWLFDTWGRYGADT
jgi:thiamine transport system permease protein